MSRYDTDTTVLAFLGDGVYECYVREQVLKTGIHGADRLHRMAVGYVNAKAQAMAIKTMKGELTEEEADLVRRARNKNPGTRAKNTDVMTYKWATAFEALVGYLHREGRVERNREIMARAMAIIEEERTKGRHGKEGKK